MTRPHAPQSYTRSDSFRLALMVPQAEHVLDDGNHRSATTTSVPYQAALYSSWARNAPNAASETWRASARSWSIPATFRSSIVTEVYPRASCAVMPWSVLVRRCATRACITARRCAAFFRPAESLLVLE